MSRIHVPNDKCTPEMNAWLIEHVGYGGWKEWFNPFYHTPYRCFEIFDEELSTMFTVMWS